VSTLTVAIATGVLALVAGRLWAACTIRRLRQLLRRALWTCGHDPLTRLPNRAYAEHLLAKQAGRPTAIALIDLNGFKQVNDTWGHQVGDQLLVTVADRLADGAHKLGGHAARLGGDEFLLLLPARYSDGTAPVAVLLANLTTPVQLTDDDTGQTVRLAPTATAGITWYDGHRGSWSSLLRQADIALYHARAAGTWYQLYRPGMHMPGQPSRHGPRLRHQRPTDHGQGGQVDR
jgi:diguanylate cyclase (GGDEF)-like protein